MNWKFELSIDLKVSKEELQLISKALDKYNDESPLARAFAKILSEVEKI